MSGILDRLARRSAATLRVLGGPLPAGKTPAAVRLEGEGAEAWLTALGSRTFTGAFSDFHRDLWSWYWPLTLKRMRGEPLTEDELAFLAVWFRGGGKSAHVEWCCIAEGALLGEGFVMYVSDTEDQAKNHVAAIRRRLESSEIARYYPGLASPELARHGRQVGWRQDYLATASGWGIVPVGLDQGIRGGRKDDLRFTLVVLDDIDDHNDTPAAAEKKLNTISRTILPAGRRDTVVLFAQNLIHEDGVLNRILTRRSDVLSERKVSGPVPAFSDVEIVTDDAPDGRRWAIKSARPTWADIDMGAARRYLARSGRAAFLAEYQHDFAGDRAERVLKNWDDKVHVITRSEFARVFGSEGVPRRWYKYVFHDWARTKSAYHANVAGLVAVSSQGEPLPGFVFLYDCMSFGAGTEADDVALGLLKRVAPGEDWDSLAGASLRRDTLERHVSSMTQLISARRDVLARVFPPRVSSALQGRNFVRWRMSHEQAKGAMQVYRQVYGLPFQPANPGADGGVEMINHYMKVDYAAPHPFRPGEAGYSRFFMVVEDDKLPYPSAAVPDELHGSDLARYQFKHWRDQPLKVTDSGAAERGPVKMNDDFGNGLMMLFHDNSVSAAPLTEAERRDAERPAGLRAADIAAITDPEVASAAIMGQMFYDAEREREGRRESARGFRAPRIRFRRG